MKISMKKNIFLVLTIAILIAIVIYQYCENNGSLCSVYKKSNPEYATVLIPWHKLNMRKDFLESDSSSNKQLQFMFIPGDRDMNKTMSYKPNVKLKQASQNEEPDPDRELYRRERVDTTVDDEDQNEQANSKTASKLGNSSFIFDFKTDHTGLPQLTTIDRKVDRNPASETRNSHNTQTDQYHRNTVPQAGEQYSKPRMRLWTNKPEYKNPVSSSPPVQGKFINKQPKVLHGEPNVTQSKTTHPSPKIPSAFHIITDTTSNGAQFQQTGSSLEDHIHRKLHHKNQDIIEVEFEHAKAKNGSLSHANINKHLTASEKGEALVQRALLQKPEKSNRTEGALKVSKRANNYELDPLTFGKKWWIRGRKRNESGQVTDRNEMHGNRVFPNSETISQQLQSKRETVWFNNETKSNKSILTNISAPTFDIKHRTWDNAFTDKYRRTHNLLPRHRNGILPFTKLSCKPLNIKLLLFNRIFKTGSTSIEKLLEELSERKNFSWTRATTEDWYDNGDSYPYPEIIEEYYRNLTKNNSIGAFAAHFYFRKDLNISQPHTYIGILRGPVRRIVSHYHYMRQRYMRPRRRIQELMDSGQWNESLKTCVLQQHKGCQDNIMTSFFCGNTSYCKTGSAKALLQAKVNMQRYYAAIGVQERLKDFLLILRRRLPRFFHDKRVFLSHEKENSDPDYFRDVSPDVLNLIRRRNKVDLELYRFAKARFQRQLAKCLQM